MRFFFEIAYNGKNYAGWQSQNNAVGVQEVVEKALGMLLKTEIKIVGSGRTDAGVHCEQQFFHADISQEFDIFSLHKKLNAFLHKDISIQSIRKVKDDAHARYSASERSYEYRITLQKNPFLDGLAWHYIRPLDVPLMNKATAILLDTNDFEAFSKVKTDVNNFLCYLKNARWQQDKQQLVFCITANRFLRGMVRAIVGTLTDVGNGKLSLNEFKTIIESRDRKKAGANAPPHGLYLTKVKYPKIIYLK